MIADEELLEAWAGGDKKAGSQLVDRYVHIVARFFENKLESEPDVQEATTRVFELCVRDFGRLDAPRSFRTFLLGTADGVLRETWRRRTGSPTDPVSPAARDLGPWLFRVIHDPRETRLLLDAVRNLPFGLDTLVELAYFEAQTRREIARALGLAPGTISSRLRRAHELLEAQVEALAPSPELARRTRARLAELAQFARRGLGPDDPDDPEPAAA